MNNVTNVRKCKICYTRDNHDVTAVIVGVILLLLS